MISLNGYLAYCAAFGFLFLVVTYFTIRDFRRNRKRHSDSSDSA